MAEFAITLPAFLLLMLSSIAMLDVVLKESTLQNAVDHASRFASLGYTYSADNSGVDSVLNRIEHLSGLEIDGADFSVCPVAPGQTSCAVGQNSRGVAGNLMLVKARKRLPLIGSMMDATIDAWAVVKNEPGFELHVPAVLADAAPGTEPRGQNSLTRQGA